MAPRVGRLAPARRGWRCPTQLSSVLGWALAVSGCGAKTPPNLSAPTRSACLIPPDSALPQPRVATLAVDGRGRRPTVDSTNSPLARLVARQRFRTLVELDCAGQVAPALARRWSSEADGS